jgi:hypothetical protein
LRLTVSMSVDGICARCRCGTCQQERDTGFLSLL